jgi:hypothetical protein
MIDQAVDEGASDAVASKSGTDVQPFHLATPMTQGLQPGATRRLTVPSGKDEGSTRFGVRGRQVPHILFESHETLIRVDGSSIFDEKRTDFFEERAAFHLYEFKHSED